MAVWAWNTSENKAAKSATRLSQRAKCKESASACVSDCVSEWVRCEWERECALVCQDYGGFLATKRKSPLSSLLLLLLLLLFAQAPTATPIFLHVPFLWVQILSAQLEFEWISSCFVYTHAHTGTHRHEPHSHQVDIVSSSSSLLSLARRFHLINCVYKKEMNCHAQQQQQLVVYACVCERATVGAHLGLL